jgi:hypothetical protein
MLRTEHFDVNTFIWGRMKDKINSTLLLVLILLFNMYHFRYINLSLQLSKHIWVVHFLFLAAVQPKITSLLQI